MTFASIKSWPELHHPVLVVGLEGWIDAGFAGSTAIATLVDTAPSKLVATFDSDGLIDNRSRRPLLHLVDGVLKELVWPEIKLVHSEQADDDPSLLVLIGPEPDYHWREWVAEVVALAARLGVEMVVGLGAFPAPVPHTRPIRLAATATDQELAGRIGYMPATIDVPAGVQAVLEMAFGEAGVPAVGIWARVPHYAAGSPYPEAAVALLDQLSDLTGVRVATGGLRDKAKSSREEIDRQIANSPDHLALVRQLEEQHDAEVGLSATEFSNLPTGDELAAELEKYLRGEGR